MKLKVLASGSSGNSYILENETEALILEAGIPFKELIRHVYHRKIVGCVVSHEHMDHAAYQGQYQMRGIETFTPYILRQAKDLSIRFGNFSIVAFDNNHNVPCYGFRIKHDEIGQLVFATDTGHIDYRFKHTNHWLIEANYSKEILDKRVEEGFEPHLADRIVKDHMSLESCKLYFARNDLSNTREIVLIHLSDLNSNAEQFKKEIRYLTSKDVYIAEKGLEIDLSLCPI